MRIRWITVSGFLICILSGWFLLPHQNIEDSQLKSTSTSFLPVKNESFAKVLNPRKFIFPQDHGPHPDYHIEWWYFTGNLQTVSGRKFGYELTFFRFALSAEEQISQSNWRNNQMYMAHFALTDVNNRKFHTDERFSRSGNGLAGAKTEKYHVWLYDWKAEAINDKNMIIHLNAKSDNFAISLQLDSQKKMALQGINGFSQKSQKAGNASYYYSYTRMATTGNIQIKQQNFSISGFSWMDREWTSGSLSTQQVGWDWFALQLSDHSDLMFYSFKRKDGGVDKFNAGAIYYPDNSRTSLNFSEVDIKTLDHWTSPHTNITYPSKWRMSIPSLKLELIISPLINDQELNVTYRYWEGAVSIKGEKNGELISGQGYVELTGYQ